ncbi:MAG: serine/threonine protein kinase [Gammaproteobacteria bacterium]|nr:serine/threonine protein kinase [Gammaproteobacteria bacterium]NNC96938.1 serine/threonine protein kinase [Gammaproteobacteria bacterium]NNM13353.1 serine/threonine protein kinase [Gammaproteobacteria bacterium]
MFGTISKEFDLTSQQWLVCRNTNKARWWTRWIARYLAHREARALKHLDLPGYIPELLHWNKGLLLRSWQEGEPMHIAKPTHAAYFSDALALLRTLHLHKIAHNDLAKETNWLVTPAGKPALVDFQLARHFKKRSKWFRYCAREDIRYLLKHKRGFCPEHMSAREQAMVATPGIASRIWKQTGKRAYLFITRKIFKWQDREGAYDRNE